MEQKMTVEDMLYEMWYTALSHVQDEEERVKRARRQAKDVSRLRRIQYSYVKECYDYFVRRGKTRQDAQFAIACMK